MAWQPYKTTWRSLVWDHELPSNSLPLVFATPDLAWDYGAITRMLEPPAAGALILRLTCRAEAGRVGVSLAKTNGSALLSVERPVTPEDGQVTLYFRLPAGLRPASFLVRNYDDPDRTGRLHVEAVEAVAEGALDSALAAHVAPAAD